MKHMIKNFARYALIALVAISVVMSGSVAAATTHTVDPATDGTVDNEYATIQEAVDAAAAGDTISITPGTYEETVLVETDDLTLQSATEGSDVTIDASALDGEALTINADGVTISDDIYVVNKTGGSTLLASDDSTDDDGSTFDLMGELTKERFGVPYALSALGLGVSGYYFYFREQ